MKRRERRAARLAFAGGLLILLGGGSGSAALYLRLLDAAVSQVRLLGPLAHAAAVLLPLLAALGGLAVMSGAFLLRDGQRLAGVVLMDLGSGAGILGIVVGVAAALASGLAGFETMLAAFAGLSGLGVAMTLVARGMLAISTLQGVRTR